MVVAAVVVLGQRALRVDRAAELAAPDHQRVCRAGRAASGPSAARRSAWSVSWHWLVEVARQVAVLVPAAVQDLHDAHAALDQPPGQQRAVRRTCRASVTSGPYRSSMCCGLLREVGQFRHAASACGRPSRTGRCASGSPDRRAARSVRWFSSAERVEHARGGRRRRRPADSARRAPDRRTPRRATPLYLRRQEAAAPHAREQRLAVAARLGSSA